MAASAEAVQRSPRGLRHLDGVVCVVGQRTTRGVSGAAADGAQCGTAAATRLPFRIETFLALAKVEI